MQYATGQLKKKTNPSFLFISSATSLNLSGFDLTPSPITGPPQRRISNRSSYSPLSKSLNLPFNSQQLPEEKLGDTKLNKSFISSPQLKISSISSSSSSSSLDLPTASLPLYASSASTSSSWQEYDLTKHQDKRQSLNKNLTIT